MVGIRIQNFGALKDTGLMHIKPVTVLCGPQSSGKSAIAKLFSLFSWFEKSFLREDLREADLMSGDSFRNTYCAYHLLGNYFHDNTYILFEGDYYEFEYSEQCLSVRKVATERPVSIPQITYVPADRNVISALEHAEAVRNLPPSLATLIEEFRKALRNTQEHKLPIDTYGVSYDKLTDNVYITEVANRTRILLREASSGLQSVAPLELVNRYLCGRLSQLKNETLSAKEQERVDNNIAKLLAVKNLDDAVRRSLLEKFSGTLRPSRLLSIIEEPEQNLYPSAQRQLLYSLLEVKNEVAGNTLLFTTHSPYMVSYLTLVVKAANVGRCALTVEDAQRLETVVPRKARVASEELAIYQIDKAGYASPLPFVRGIPSDESQLNTLLGETNSLYDQLLDIEDRYGDDN